MSESVFDAIRLVVVIVLVVGIMWFGALLIRRF